MNLVVVYFLTLKGVLLLCMNLFSIVCVLNLKT